MTSSSSLRIVLTQNIPSESNVSSPKEPYNLPIEPHVIELSGQADAAAQATAVLGRMAHIVLGLSLVLERTVLGGGDLCARRVFFLCLLRESFIE